jgi:hypothetical protein
MRVALSSLLALALLLPGDRAHGAVPPSFYAINAGPVLFTLPAAEQAAHLDAIRAAGIGQVRTDSGWHLAEPRPPVDGVHRYHWGYNDRVVAALARAGLTLYALLDYGTGWGGVIPGDAMSPPRDAGDFAAYAAAFAGRYGPGGDFWRERPELPRRPATTFEVWNEPNVIGFWHPAPDAALYARMLAAAADAIARVDPALRVAVGGLDNTGASLWEGPAFLAAMLAARPDLAGKVDAVGIHDYNVTTEAMLARLVPMRTLVDRLLGPDVALDVTEIGWATAGTLPPVLVAPPVSESTRAGLYTALVETLSRSDCTLGVIAPYAWLTPEGAPLLQTDFFGIAGRDATLKPSGVAFREAVLRSQTRPAPAAALDVCHRPGARLPDVVAAAPPAAPAPRLRVRLAPRSACRRGRALLRVHAGGGARRIVIRVDGRRRRTLTVPAGGVLRVRLPAGARRVVVVARAASGAEVRRAVRVRGHCRRGSARKAPR